MSAHPYFAGRPCEAVRQRLPLPVLVVRRRAGHSRRPAAASVPAAARVSVGKLERLALAPSKFVEARPVEVWLPDDYAAKARAGKRFQVLYMHDGQMLFDPATTWNKTAWNVHATLARLMREGKVDDTIIVGIFNIAKNRYFE